MHLSPETVSTSGDWTTDLASPYGLVRILQFMALNPDLKYADLPQAYRLTEGKRVRLYPQDNLPDTARPAGPFTFPGGLTLWVDKNEMPLHSDIADMDARLCIWQKIARDPAFAVAVAEPQQYTQIRLASHAALMSTDLRLEKKGFRAIPAEDDPVQLGYVSVAWVFSTIPDRLHPQLIEAIRRFA